MSKNLIIIGGEGNGGVIAACIEDNKKQFNDFEWQVAGFINDYEDEVNGYPVIGGLNEIPELLNNLDYFFIWAIHLIGRNVFTEKLFKEAKIPMERMATVIHRSAFIANNAKIEPGSFIMSNCYIGPGAEIGYGTLIMSNCMIGHNTKIGPLCHCSVGAIMVGYSELGLCSDLGVGSTILAYKKIGKFGMAGANSLITRDVPDYEIHVGSPAKFLKRVRED